MAESDQNQKNLGTTCKNLGKPKKPKTLEQPKKPKNPKKQKKQFSESLGWDPPSKESRNIFFWFSKVFCIFFGFPRFLQVFPRFFLVSASFFTVFWFSQVFASFFKVFPRFFPSVGYCKETGMNHRQSCQSAFGSAVKHQKTISKDHLKLWENCTPRGCRSAIPPWSAARKGISACNWRLVTPLACPSCIFPRLPFVPPLK